MKKCLSLIVVFALILTTLAMPMTASAYDISLQADAGDVTITFGVPTEPVKPGETFEVVVKATATGDDVTATEAQVEIAYNTSAFTYKSAASLAANAEVNEFDNYVQYLLVNGLVTVGAEEVTLATLTFEVKETADPHGYEFNLDGNGDTYFYFGNGSWYTVAAEAATVTVTENVAIAKVGEVELQEKTYYQTSLTINIVGDGVGEVTLKEGDAEAEIINAEEPIILTTTNDYVLTINIYGNNPKVYNFSLNTATVAAVLETEFEVDIEGYEKDDTFVIPVTITGLGTATADMVSFDVVYDAGLTMVATGTEILQTGNSVVYGNGGTATLTNGNVATLTFTVAQDAEYGKKTIKLANPQMSLENDGIDPSGSNIQVDDQTYTLTVIPSEAFAEITTDLDALTWTNQPVSVEYASDFGAEVKYLKAKDGVEYTTTTQEGLGVIFNDADAAAQPVNVNAEGTYYVVAKIGDVYQLVDEITSEEAKFDATAPVVDASGLDMSAYESSIEDYVITIGDIATDAHGIAKYQASVNGGEFADIVDGKVTIPAGTSVKGTEYVVIKAIDVAGNEATDKVTLYLDGDAPTITDVEITDDKDAAGNKTITATVADATSNATAMIYVGAADLDIEAVEALDNGVAFNGSYATNVPGTYYIVATDAASNKAMASKLAEFDTAAVPAIKVAVVKDATTTPNVFTANVNNGSFTYVKVELATETAAGYNTKMLLDDVEWDGEIDNAEANRGEKTLKVVTTHNNDLSDTATVEYKFTIVSESAMPSVNNDNRFNIIDYGIVSDVVEAGKALPDAETLLGEFTGGIYAGDVDGDFGYDNDDVAELIRSIRAGERPGSYTFKFLNKAVVEDEPGEEPVE